MMRRIEQDRSHVSSPLTSLVMWFSIHFTLWAIIGNLQYSSKNSPSSTVRFGIAPQLLQFYPCYDTSLQISYIGHCMGNRQIVRFMYLTDHTEDWMSNMFIAQQGGQWWSKGVSEKTVLFGKTTAFQWFWWLISSTSIELHGVLCISWKCCVTVKTWTDVP